MYDDIEYTVMTELLILDFEFDGRVSLEDLLSESSDALYADVLTYDTEAIPNDSTNLLYSTEDTTFSSDLLDPLLMETEGALAATTVVENYDPIEMFQAWAALPAVAFTGTWAWNSF